MSPLDWGIVGLYLVFALGVGLLLRKKGEASTSAFFLGGRSLPWWVIGTSMVATTFAADTPLAITEMVRTGGIWKNWWWWNIAMGGLLGVFLFSRLWRRAEVLTDNELIEIRYSGRPAAFLRGFKACWFAVFYNFIVMGWVINGMSTVITVLTGYPPALVTWTLVAITVVYTVLSGFYGVVITDLVQFLIAMSGSVILAVLAVKSVGGMESLLAKLQEVPEAPAHLLALVPPLDAGSGGFLSTNFFSFMVFITVMWWSSHNADGGGYIIQRMSACRDERDAFKATLWFTVANYALRVWPWVIVALVSLVLFPALQDHKQAYPMVLNQVLHSGLKGLLVTSFLAAFMSTIDTHLNWGASYIVHDVYRRFIRPVASETHYVWVSRITILVLICTAAVISGYMTSIEKAWVFIWATGAGIGLVLILRWFWWRINAWSELSALATSILVTIGLEVLAWAQSAPGEYHLFASTASLFGQPLGSAHKALIVVPLSIIVWLTVTLLTRPEPEATLKAFVARVRPGGAWGPYTVASPDNVLGGILPRWLGGVMLVYGMTFSIGSFLLQRPGQSSLLLLTALAGIWLLRREHDSGKGFQSMAGNTTGKEGQ
ncbi:MAG: Na+:solute symporter [Calditrichaeota bacterium]|nr:Na+:solute symporter [Calditrichota bacterium]MCB9474070.1 Na+:solute symporter [Candidatus Delongbacteria bacterium]